MEEPLFLEVRLRYLTGGETAYYNRHDGFLNEDGELRLRSDRKLLSPVEMLVGSVGVSVRL